ncbi:hypothetical protein BHE74_00014358 [Ensete ventricosum]|nr:hypothetical protein BHE74_00014358 [Ensete ventricosum]
MALRQIYHHETGLRPSSSSGLVGIPVPNPFRLRFRPSPALPLARTRSELGGGEEQGKAEKGDGEAKKGRRKEGVTLDDVNPVGLGRRSRQIFDEVWRKFSGLGQISRSLTDDDEGLLLIRGPMCEFTVPEAQDTTVLVVGATSRIGRIVVRKLMLRGYKVKKSLASSLIPFLLQDMFSLEVDMLNFPKSSLFHWAQPLTGALYRPLVWFDALHCFLYRWYCLNTIHYLILYCHMVRYDGLLLSVGGNGKPYILILETGPLADTSQSKLYFARINTKVGFCRVRISLTLHLLDFFLLVFYVTQLVSQSFLFQAGEDALRRSGLGYTIIRPGPLRVAHLPDKANNYLTPALSVLEKNT